MDAFYNKGLMFTCTQCSNCCRHEPGIVLLSHNDLEHITYYLGLSIKEFVETYCTYIPSAAGTYISIKEKKNNDCIFWDSGCTIYKVRPLQCKSYPFWPRIMDNAQNWKDESKYCKGINTGTLHDQKEIESWLDERKNNEPVTKEMLHL